MAAPAEKKQKTEHEAEDQAEEKVEDAALAAAKEAAPAAVEEKKAPEPPKELEEDAKKEKSPVIKDVVTFLKPDTTMNVLPASVGNMLMPLTDGGLSQLVACARASVGVKSGRYMFEAKIVEQISNRASVRVGFSAAGSLFLGDDDNSICFDSMGAVVSNKKQTRNSASFGRDIIVAVLLNLDESSPNFNTISLFRDGKRVCQPQALPDALKGKTLFPAIAFRDATVHLNFAAPATPLPFTCKSVGEAAQAHAVVTKYDEPADGKYTVLFPVSLPDEGTFDWLDTFLEKNPSYTEISDRTFAVWAQKSGLKANVKKDSNDKPGVPDLHDLANVKKTLMELASLQPRNFVVMEVKGNLIKEERAKTLQKFKNPVFKTVAEIIFGDPPKDFKKLVQAKVLKAKQDTADRVHKVKQLQEKREWAQRKKAKEQATLKKAQEKERKQKEEEAKTKREEAARKAAKEMAKKKAEKEGKELPAEEEEEEKKEEEEKPAEEDEAMEAEEPEPVETDCPKVELTAEETSLKFFSHAVKDLTEKELALSFAKFTLPEAGEFGTAKYSWAKEKDAATYLKDWILERKLTTRVEDIVPSAWFKQKTSAWAAESQKWKNKQNDYKAMLAKKAADKKAKADKKLAAEKKAKAEAEAKAKAVEAKAKAAAEAAEKGEEAKEETKEEEKIEEKEEETKPEVVEEEAEEEPEIEIDFEGVDVFGTEDIMDVGGNAPLFRDFGFDDHAMMALRFEIHTLVHSFANDCTDPDRKGIPLDHLGFYYQKYNGKTLVFQQYGVNTAADLVALVDDCIAVTKQNTLASLIPAELESNSVFAKITEAARRHRLVQLDMGEESARLKISKDNGHAKHDKGGGKAGAWGGDKKRVWGQASGGDWGKGGDAGKGADWGKSKMAKMAVAQVKGGDWGKAGKKDGGDGKGKSGDWGKAAGKGEDWGKAMGKGEDWGKAGKKGDDWGKAAGKGGDWGKAVGKGGDWGKAGKKGDGKK